MSRQELLSRYRTRGYKRVDGWLSADAVEIICSVADIQQQWGLDGDVAEIGIHHGKLFILLCLLAGADKKCHAYDLFAQQADNTDRSGWGDRQHFEQNLQRHGCEIDRVIIHEGNSLDLKPAHIRSHMENSARLFSVDGGHSAENTYYDITLACAALATGGIVILDDYFNQNWPAVSEGAMRFMIDHPDTLFPIVIGGNKVVLNNDAEHAEAYRVALIDHWQPWRYTHSRFLDSPVLIFSKRDRIGRYLQHSALGKRLRGSKGAERLRQIQRRITGR